MIAFERTQTLTLARRLGEKPRQLIIVTGPRQTGKTTVVLQVLNKMDRPCHYLSADKPDPGILSPFPNPGGLTA